MIVVVGVSHHTAPIEIREKVALDPERAERLLSDLAGDPRVSEVFVVSTCNRVEIVAVPKGADSDSFVNCANACAEGLARIEPSVTPHLYRHGAEQAVRHLLRVASSLDSLVVGEPQILGQLKQGFELGRERKTVGSVLHRVIARVVRGAKSVRSETTIGAGQVSIPSIAVELATQIFGSLRGHEAILVGAGEMGQTVTKLLADAGAKVHVVGRNREKLEGIGRDLGASVHTMNELPELLKKADIVVSSTSASDFVLRSEDVIPGRKARRGRNLFLIDLAVPRDIEPSVGKVDGVFLYNVDDLAEVAEASAATRRKEAERASEIIEKTLRDFMRWMGGEQATPVIKALRARLRGAMEVELEKSFRGKLRGLAPEEREAIGKMLDSSLNRMLHAPTLRLRLDAAAEEGEELALAMSKVFDLERLGSDGFDAEASDEVAEEEEANRIEETGPRHASQKVKIQ